MDAFRPVPRDDVTQLAPRGEAAWRMVGQQRNDAVQGFWPVEKARKPRPGGPSVRHLERRHPVYTPFGNVALP